MQASPSTAASTAPPTNAVQFVRKHLLSVPAYTPIEPFEVLSARYGRTPQQIVKLDANENPYGPPPEVRQALAEMPWPHIYPDPETRQLRKALSELSDVPEEYLMVRRARAFGPLLSLRAAAGAGGALVGDRFAAALYAVLAPYCGSTAACGCSSSCPHRAAA
jgi:histidinol-phosphate/aromatic aminotransferase/cobyric acid decarboxylase-like protein